ncbi:MAG: hypothetical protein A2660_02920 [Candidatus Doudnabacteria bacterium RIFCSPHIGHO2_01_FULL_45_18]|uniref:Bacterial type II secretion system protein E domain-containing protein n=1 Tax=Candidatus Doudnabacteria bacterium RIFCSPHIGHO2_01_FULL_45_18 TaxID=1817823 RepID=A0A1F5NQQ9_9BACT|nr:MAG: hypothetical protein A2660_02920 [Candidatus Doudnabacteria bacterium RIFCSPHIGHO2_01_FULL_45_18]
MQPLDKAAKVKQVYTELNRKFEEEETQTKATDQKIAYLNLYGFPIDPQALALVSFDRAQTLGAAIFLKEKNHLKVGITQRTDEASKLLKELSAQGYLVDVVMISNSSLQHALDEYSKVIVSKHKSEAIILKSSDYQIGALSELAAKFSGTSATGMIESILGFGLHLAASDVHIEPEAGASKIRFRIDGVLQDAATLPQNIYQQIISRVKILSKVKLNVTNTPQDGSFSLTLDSAPIDIRVSVIPSAFGESVVMRILRQDKGSLQFDELGLTGLAKEQMLQEIQKPNGMILTTGPTGSGKTTTLYAILNKLNEPGVKIITLEDPVEYKLTGITQTPIDARVGMTFAAGLRAILRQDPDIVMVGEMRDLETAETACQAALTGHIVLSTLHTNDAAATLPRLLDLGVKPFVLGPAINAIIAQRLVRKICQSCKVVYQLPANLQSRVEMILKTIPKASRAEIPSKLIFYHSPGCDKCQGLGYKGRIGVYEMFVINDAIEKLIIKMATTTEIKKQAIVDGMLTMAQDGLLKALQGITDVEEVFRVTEE